MQVTCRNCERLKRRVGDLEHENAALNVENSQLRRRLVYENPNTPPSQGRYPLRQPRNPDAARYPGPPKGHVGRTRPKPKPDVVKSPPRKERCDRCGVLLGEPSYVNHHLVEEISNPHPRLVVDFLEFEWGCVRCGTHTISRHPDCSTAHVAIVACPHIGRQPSTWIKTTPKLASGSVGGKMIEPAIA